MKRAAEIIAYVFHPVFMLTYVMVYFLFTENYFAFFMSPVKKLFLLSAVIIFTVVLPLLNLVTLKKLGYIKSLRSDEAGERMLPYVSSLVLYAGLIYILHDLSIPYFFKQLVIVSFTVILADFILNFFLKVSMHLSATGGAVGILWFYQFISAYGNIWPLCVVLLIAGLSGFSRLYLAAHTPRQVYTGFAAGLLSSLACLSLLYFYNLQF